ncbi:MAG: hypothetical protein KDA41_18570, partial [Planctomycetales bacterium]|nr:hypothetical protein [Planctomycetales bacterium]
ADPSAPLWSAIKGRSADDQRQLTPTLGRVGGAAALAAIHAAIADPATHALGVASLCNWPDGGVAGDLLAIARTDADPNLQRLALRSLIRIAPLPDGRSDRRRLDLLRTTIAMCDADTETSLALERAKAIRSIDTLRFVLPFMDDPRFAELACLTVVELAHHSGLRESHREEFHRSLDRVIAVAKDPTTVDRAQRYKKGQTWVRPKPAS